MTSRDFCFWLQGYFEIESAISNHLEKPVITGEQAAIIRRHLNMVFAHEIDPSMGDKKSQEILDAIHSGNYTATIGPESDTRIRC